MKALSLTLAPSRDNFPPDSRAARVLLLWCTEVFSLFADGLRTLNLNLTSHYFPLFYFLAFTHKIKIVLPQCTYRSVDKFARYLNRTNKCQTLHVCTVADGRRDIPAVSRKRVQGLGSLGSLNARGARDWHLFDLLRVRLLSDGESARTFEKFTFSDDVSRHCGLWNHFSLMWMPQTTEFQWKTEIKLFCAASVTLSLKNGAVSWQWSGKVASTCCQPTAWTSPSDSILIKLILIGCVSEWFLANHCSAARITRNHPLAVEVIYQHPPCCFTLRERSMTSCRNLVI